MLQLIVFVNILMFFAGVYFIINKVFSFQTRPLTVIISAVILLSVLSYLYYLMLMLNLGYNWLVAVISVVNIAHIYFTNKAFVDIFRKKAETSVNINNWWPLFTVLLLTIYFVTNGTKYGGWDAFAIWNLHAKFLYFPELWHNLFTNDLSFSSPDYPLMVPGIIAFFCKAVQIFTPIVPSLLSYALLISIPLLVFYALIEKGQIMSACLSLAIFLVSRYFKEIATSQEADSLLSLFILITFIIYQNIKEASNKEFYFLGFVCASCAWVKNEGIVFCLLFSFCFLILNYKKWNMVFRYFIGMLFPALIVITFKLFLAPANGLIAGNAHRISSLGAVLMDKNRYLTIIKFGANLLVDQYMPLVILIIMAAVLNIKTLGKLPIIVIALLLCVYFLIYLITFSDLNWLLNTSLYRLFQHVYPSLIYLLLHSLKNIKGQYKLETIP